MRKTITILRAGNNIVVSPTTARVRSLLVPHLQYTSKIFLRGLERFQATKAGLPTIYDETWDCFAEDHKNRIATAFGFYDSIRTLLCEAGYGVELRDCDPHPKPRVYTPHWDRISEYKLRHMQREILEIFAKYENARIDCHTGYGKSFIIGLACRIFPEAKIAVIARDVAVLRDTIYPDLCSTVPSVGIVGGGMNRKKQRVMCYTIGSLHHADGDEDFVFVDECHQAAADDAAAKMTKFYRARMFGLSASHNMRFDNKDVRCEAMFGPVRIVVPYQDGVEHGLVVPMRVRWRDVLCDVNPCGGLTDVDKKRHGIWAHKHRNTLIAEDARSYGEDVQVLVVVETFEHALHLKKLLPEFTLVYNGSGIPAADWRYYESHELIPEGFRMMTDVRRRKLTRRFERGTLKKVIVTKVFNAGVNFKHLAVLVRAEAGSSPINDVQIPGRASRINDQGKVVGIIHDYLDQFDAGFKQNAIRRGGSYERLGWKQVFRNKNKSRLRQMLWGD